MPVNVSDRIDFKAENQSMWRAGTPTEIYFGTGDTLFVETPELNLGDGFGDPDALFVDFNIRAEAMAGLEAYARLGTNTGFNANLSYDIAVEYDAAVDLDADTIGTFEIASVDFASGSLENGEAQIAPKAAIDFVASAYVGVYGRVETTASTHHYSFAFIDEPEYRHTLIGNGVDEDYEREFAADSKIVLRAPSLPDAGTFVTGDGGAWTPALTAQGSGRDNPFVEIVVDIDEVISEMNIPGLSAAIGNIFFSQELDLNSYLPFVPEGAVKAEFTLMDIKTDIRAYLDQELELTLNDPTDPIQVAVRSDQGTPSDLSDDVIITSNASAGQEVQIDYASAVLNNGTSDVTLTATYDVKDASLRNEVALRMDGKFHYQALSGGINLNFDYLFGTVDESASFGPLIEAILPFGGGDHENFIDINVYDGEFELAQNAFNSIEKTYEVFVVNNGPDNWDTDGPNAVQQFWAYREALQENAANSFTNFDGLWTPPPQGVTQDLVTLGLPPDPDDFIDTSASNTSILWQGNLDSDVEIDRSASARNFVLIDPVSSDDGLRADLILNDGTPSYSDPVLIGGNGVGAFSAAEDKITFLTNLGLPAVDVTALVYHHGDDTLKTNKPVNIVGSSANDLLVRHGTGDRFFDGGEGFDVFVADFATTNPGLALEFTTRAATAEDGPGWIDFYGSDGIDIIPGTTIKNVEGMVLRTGAQNDDVSSGTTQDIFVTGAGEDLITLHPDSAVDYVLAGADDDVIIVRNTLESDILEDQIYGGTGADLVVFRRDIDETAPNFDPMVIFGTQIGIDLNGIGSYDATAAWDSDVSALEAVLDTYAGGDFDEIAAGDPTLRDSYNDPSDNARLILTGFGEKAVIHKDVEAVSFYGTDYSSDTALFNGGLVYDGGEGFVHDPSGQESGLYAQTDTFIGDFGAYETTYGVTSGINFRAEDRLNEDGTLDLSSVSETTTFGRSIITGYERLAVAGTSFDDVLIGGKYSDLLRGGDGDDYIDGGETKDDLLNAKLTEQFRDYISDVEPDERDYIYGGYGDDTIVWSDDGWDRIFGDQIGGGVGYNDQLIIRSESGSHALWYGLYDANHAYAGAAHRFHFNANSTDAELLHALSIVGDGDLVDTNGTGTLLEYGTGVRFSNGTTADDEDWMQYRGMDRVNITSQDNSDDLHIYEGGATYAAGEKADDTDVDVFAGDFTGQKVGFDFEIIADDDTGTLMRNGLFVQGFERAVILGSDASDTFFGGAEADYFDGGLGDDLLYGGDTYALGAAVSADVLKGGEGNDTAFWYTDGNDTIEGGNGEDTIVLGTRGQGWRWNAWDDDTGTVLLADVHAGSSFATLNAALNDLSEIDRFTPIVLSENGSEVHQLSFKEFEHLSMSGADAYDDLGIIMGNGIVWGGEQVGDRDVLLADLGTETADLVLRVGDDQAGMGPDGAGEFDENGDYQGSFEELSDIGNGTFVGGFERLHFSGGMGNDHITGGAFTDAIFGGAGDDRLDGGGGGTTADRDVVSGQNGDDTLIYTGGHAWFDGGNEADDYDTMLVDIDPALSTSGIQLKVLDDNGAQLGPTFIAGSGANNTVNRADIATLMALAPSFAGDLNGPAIADALELNFGTESLIYRNIENAILRGGSGDDFLAAPLRNGAIFAADGDDVLVSGVGLDLLIGGAGLDTYVFDDANGGFGADKIVLEDYQGAVLHFNNLASTDVTYALPAVDTDDLVISSSGGSITIVNYFADNATLGLDFTFDFTDFTGTIDFSTILTGIVPTGSGASGLEVEGTVANDILTDQTSANEDYYAAGAGDDIMAGSPGSDFFDGGSGYDVVNYADDAATSGVSVDLQFHEGTFGDAAGDVLFGIEGIFGTHLTDVFSGDRLGNSFFGGDGDDFAEGRGGNDLLDGGDGHDSLDGWDGDDLLLGDVGDDTLNGNEGDDTLIAGDGNDSISGGDGDDLISGGAGDDSFAGGAGDDTLKFGAGDEASVGTESFDGNEDSDFVDFSDYSYAITVVHSNNDASFGTVSTPQTENAVDDAPVLDVLDYINTEGVIGTDFDDLFELDEDPNAFFPSSGTMIGGFGDDMFRLNGEMTNSGFILIGGPGSDWFEATYVDLIGLNVDLANNTLYDGTSAFHTISSIENIIGSPLDDTIYGNEAQNWFSDGEGEDDLRGLGGDDYIVANVSTGTVYDDQYWGGDGFDVIDYSAATNGLEVNLTAASVEDRIGHGPSSVAFFLDIIYNFEHIITGSGNDLVTVGDGQGLYHNDVFSHTIDTGAGDDEVISDAGAVYIIGGAGNDIYTDAAFDPDGGFADVLDYSGIASSITLTIGSGQQATISGADIGSDTATNFERYVAGQGDDSFTGSAANDYFDYTAAAGLGGFDLFDGAGGQDVVSLAEFEAAIRVDLEAAIEVTTRDTLSMDPALGGTLRDVADLTSIETVILTRFDDQFYGTSGDDYLDGSAGNDTLAGRDGDDTLVGGQGLDLADYSDLGSSQSVIVDLSGLVLGYVGATDSSTNTDQFEQIEGAIGGAGDDLLFGSLESNILTGGAGGDTISGTAGANFINGNEGNDALNGGIDADTIDGGAGNDLIDGGDGDDLMLLLEGVDTVTGGDGADKFLFGVAENGATAEANTFAARTRIDDFTPTDGDLISLMAFASGTYFDTRPFTLRGETNATNVGDALGSADLGPGYTEFYWNVIGGLVVLIGDTNENHVLDADDFAVEFAAGTILDMRHDYFEAITERPNVVLTQDVLDDRSLGNKFNGQTDADGVVTAGFEFTGTDLVLDFKGYDVDFANEVELFLNGVSQGYLEAGVNNGFADYTLEIAAADQVAGENIIAFEQASNVNWKWGVTDLLLSEVSTADMSLTLGVLESGSYGNKFNGQTDADGVVMAGFEFTGTDLVLDFKGYDVDYDTEIELFLNGVSQGYLEAGVNNGLADYTLEIAAADQVAGENIIAFEQASNVNWKWGVTDLLLSEVEVADMSLTLGVLESGSYGNKFNGQTDADGVVTAEFEFTGTDLMLDFKGYDVDYANEIELFLNGVSQGYIEAGVNNGLADYTLEIAAADQVAGDNIIAFEQASNVNWKWGVTDLLLMDMI